MIRKAAILIVGVLILSAEAQCFGAPIPAKEKTITLEIEGMV
jgi:hypothetical protein